MVSHKYLPQIDILKAIMIIFVLLMHSLPVNLLDKVYFNLWLGQAVPIFIIILGFNQGSSFYRKLKGDRPILNLNYYFKKFIRFIFPLFLAFLMSVLLGLFYYLIKHNNILRLNRYLIFGRLPLAGPGNYFISLLIQYTLTLPFLYKFYLIRPRLSYFLVILLAIFSEIIRNDLNIYLRDYLLNYFRYLPGLILGFWLVGNWQFKKNIFIYMSVLISFVYLLFFKNWKVFNFLSFFYALAIVIFSLRKFPQGLYNPFINLLTFLGKISFHIFLVQIIYFSFVKTSGNILIFSTIFNLFSCILLGLLFNKLNIKLVKLVFIKFNEKSN